ncbi:LOW QUALITY PROTEIN: hypothetical protein PHMEG_00017158 [Phytophthora megakarya]|uniref:Integrase catalytic domain-containing protein n=1 Tax=Phytophthora megakarya TaxID=4795 RepID=A0A225VWZ1_9STRA|nr:LOW QUALITY PROTEIN: hypothetical protein PHMEG_00017158 [Phytophthora megakarya]
MSSTTAQDCAEAYEEVVFRNYGASSEIRHDRDPRFMSRVFRCFSEMMGIQQKATLAYRPQANGQQERSGQTIMHRIRAYVKEPDQTDWDDHAEKLMLAMNTSFDATRLDSVPRTNGVGNCNETTAMPTSELQKRAKRTRSAVQTQKWKVLSDHLESGFEVGDSGWLYIPKVLPGLSRKLAYLWHGPFRIEQVRDDFKGTGYRVEPWVHISRLKPRALFPKRPSLRIDVSEEDDFDAALLPEDSWDSDSVHEEYEVEEIVDLRWTKRT